MKIEKYNPEQSEKGSRFEPLSLENREKSKEESCEQKDVFFEANEDLDFIPFSPAHIFYESSSGKYFVDVGRNYRAYGRRAPVVRGVAEYLENNESDNDGEVEKFMDRANEIVASIEVKQAVDWAGGIAGYKKGIVLFEEFTALITSEPKLIKPKKDTFPVISGILFEGLGEGIQRDVFLGWLSVALKAVIAGKHQPGQLLCLAGQANTGKSLYSKIVSCVLGGRVGDPHAAWTSSIVWNDELVKAELLVIDDSVASTDPRARRALAARFKEAIYASNVQLRKRNVSSLCVRPVWRVMICCNENSEALQIIPPIDEDLSDKVSLLRVGKITPVEDTSTPEGRERFWALIEKELPAFVDHLLNFKIPDELKDSRAGVCAYRDSDLENAVVELSPEKCLEEMLVCMLSRGYLDIDPGESRKFTAIELQGLLTEVGSPVSEQARKLLLGWSSACGVYLGKLAKLRPNMVAKAGLTQGTQKWKITRVC